MQINLANIPETLQKWNGHVIRDIQVFGVLENMVSTPWFMRGVQLSSPDLQFALVRVFAVKPLKDNPFVALSGPADLYYTKGRLLITITPSDAQQCMGKWVTVGGDLPRSGLSIRHQVASDNDSPYNIGGIAYRRPKNGGSKWEVRPNSITPYLYLPADPDNPTKVDPAIHVGFDFPNHIYLQAFDGLDSRKGMRGSAVELPNPKMSSSPQYPSVMPDPVGTATTTSEAESTPSAASDTKSAAPLTKITNVRYSDDVPPDTAPSQLVNRESSVILSTDEDFKDLSSQLSTELRNVKEAFKEGIPELSKIMYGEMSTLVSAIYLEIKDKQHAVSQYAQDSFAYWVKDKKVLGNVDRYEVRSFISDSKMSSPLEALATRMTPSMAVRVFFSFVSNYSEPISEYDFSTWLRDPWTFEALNGSSYESAYLGASMLLALDSTKELVTPNDVAASSLALHASYYSSGFGSSTGTLARLDEFRHPASPELSDFHKAFHAPAVQPHVSSLEQSVGVVSLDADTYMPATAFDSEVRMFEGLVKAADKPTKVTDDQLDRIIEAFNESKGFSLSPEQVEGVNLVRNRVGVLSGCAGSGKTTTSDCMTEVLEAAGYKVIFAAPTGKAAKRLSEVVGRPVRTIHSLFRIEVGGRPPLNPELTSRENPLDCPSRTAIIFDEMAMCDTSVFTFAVNASLRASDEIALYFLGDIKQLPPIGKGMPFRDLMALVPTVELGVSKRAAEGSLINYNCNVLNTCSPLVMPGEDVATVYNFRQDDTFRLLDCEDQQISPLLVAYIRRIIEAGMFDPEDIQVVTPYVRKSDYRDWNTMTLNPVLQGVLNPEGEPLFVHTGVEYRRGDRLIHSRNDSKAQRLVFDNGRYDLAADPSDPAEVYSGIVNGEVGTLHDILEATDPSLDGLGFDNWVVLMRVEDPDVEQGVVYIPYVGNKGAALPDNPNLMQFRSKAFHDVSLAYSISVHKSQGSQYPCVIFPIGSGDSPEFLNRNMIYTAISRAQKSVAMIGCLKDTTRGLGSLRLTAQTGENVMTAVRFLTETVLEAEEGD